MRELGRYDRSSVEANGSPSPTRADDGLPVDPLITAFSVETVDRATGAPLPPDPMADLDWRQVTGRMPHRLYAKALFVCPEGADRAALLAAEAAFLRECRNRGMDVQADEVADRRARKRRNAR